MRKTKQNLITLALCLLLSSMLMVTASAAEGSSYALDDGVLTVTGITFDSTANNSSLTFITALRLFDTNGVITDDNVSAITSVKFVECAGLNNVRGITSAQNSYDLEFNDCNLTSLPYNWTSSSHTVKFIGGTAPTWTGITVSGKVTVDGVTVTPRAGFTFNISSGATVKNIDNGNAYYNLSISGNGNTAENLTTTHASYSGTFSIGNNSNNNIIKNCTGWFRNNINVNAGGNTFENFRYSGYFWFAGNNWKFKNCYFANSSSNGFRIGTGQTTRSNNTVIDGLTLENIYLYIWGSSNELTNVKIVGTNVFLGDGYIYGDNNTLSGEHTDETAVDASLPLLKNVRYLYGSKNKIEYFSLYDTLEVQDRNVLDESNYGGNAITHCYFTRSSTVSFDVQNTSGPRGGHTLSNCAGLGEINVRAPSCLVDNNISSSIIRLQSYSQNTEITNNTFSHIQMSTGSKTDHRTVSNNIFRYDTSSWVNVVAGEYQTVTENTFSAPVSFSSSPANSQRLDYLVYKDNTYTWDLTTENRGWNGSCIGSYMTIEDFPCSGTSSVRIVGWGNKLKNFTNYYLYSSSPTANAFLYLQPIDYSKNNGAQRVDGLNFADSGNTLDGCNHWWSIQYENVNSVNTSGASSILIKNTDTVTANNNTSFAIEIACNTKNLIIENSNILGKCGIRISGNSNANPIIRNNVVGTSGTNSKIHLYRTTGTGEISNNAVYYAIQVEYYTHPNGGISIKNNTGPMNGGRDAIRVTNTSGPVTIENNIFNGGNYFLQNNTDTIALTNNVGGNLTQYASSTGTLNFNQNEFTGSLNFNGVYADYTTNVNLSDYLGGTITGTRYYKINLIGSPTSSKRTNTAINLYNVAFVMNENIPFKASEKFTAIALNSNVSFIGTPKFEGLTISGTLGTPQNANDKADINCKSCNINGINFPAGTFKSVDLSTCRQTNTANNTIVDNYTPTKSNYSDLQLNGTFTLTANGAKFDNSSFNNISVIANKDSNSTDFSNSEILGNLAITGNTKFSETSVAGTLSLNNCDAEIDMANLNCATINGTSTSATTIKMTSSPVWQQIIDNSNKTTLDWSNAKFTGCSPLSFTTEFTAVTLDSVSFDNDISFNETPSISLRNASYGGLGESYPFTTGTLKLYSVPSVLRCQIYCKNFDASGCTFDSYPTSENINVLANEDFFVPYETTSCGHNGTGGTSNTICNKYSAITLSSQVCATCGVAYSPSYTTTRCTETYKSSYISGNIYGSVQAKLDPGSIEFVSYSISKLSSFTEPIAGSVVPVKINGIGNGSFKMLGSKIMRTYVQVDGKFSDVEITDTALKDYGLSSFITGSITYKAFYEHNAGSIYGSGNATYSGSSNHYTYSSRSIKCSTGKYHSNYALTSDGTYHRTSISGTINFAKHRFQQSGSSSSPKYPLSSNYAHYYSLLLNCSATKGITLKGVDCAGPLAGSTQSSVLIKSGNFRYCRKTPNQSLSALGGSSAISAIDLYDVKITQAYIVDTLAKSSNYALSTGSIATETNGTSEELEVKNISIDLKNPPIEIDWGDFPGFDLDSNKNLKEVIRMQFLKRTNMKYIRGLVYLSRQNKMEH